MLLTSFVIDELKSSHNLLSGLIVAIEDKLRKRALSLTPKHKLLMPDLMETLETESVKGSANKNRESESIDQQPAVEMAVPPAPGNNPIYPSFPDTFLKRLGLHGSSSFSNDQLSEQEIESKFSTLSLGFKTDKLTLSKRIELQQRQRDTAETNVENETKALKEYLNVLNQLSTTHEMRELISKIQQQVDVVHRSTCRVSSRAEIYGAVQQEERMNRAFEVMVMYVENLKRVYEKEHQELEETRRLLIENRLLPSNSSEAGNDESKMLRSLRSMSIGGGGKTESRGRLLSTVVSAVSSLGTTTGNANLSNRLSTHPSSTPPKQFMSRRSSLPAATGPVFGLGRSSIAISTLNGKSLHAEDIPEQELDYCANGDEGKKYLLKNDSSSKLDQTIQASKDENLFMMRTRRTDSAGQISAEKNSEFESLARQISVKSCEEVPLEFDSQSSLDDDGLTEQGSDDGGNLGIHEHWAVRNRTLDKSSIIRKIFWEMREWDNTTLQSRLRLILSVILVLAGVFSIVATLVPVQATTACPQTSNTSFQNILRVFFGPYLSLTHNPL
ncbi:protein MRVI1-like isoform X3 [Limulus polyphemus]|uniref:Protein MRVI1-like isoform X3 n=1 Tax=Limulus polyphemus TaxID=6850 RepID=A0ABM1BKE1_LIMPO|nr:protein MRVI1-like isoform X3 [Limulus polyphemus]